MKTAGLILLLTILAFVAILSMNQQSAKDADTPAGPIEFEVVTIQPKGKHIPKNLMMFADAIAREFDGKIQIKFLGGPEVIGPFQQPEAVRSGQIDMALVSPSYYSNLTPLSHVNVFSNQTYDVLQQNGFYAEHKEIHDEIGFAYLGEFTFDVPFYMYTNFPVDSLNDFVGKKIRVFPSITPFVRALGAAPVLMGQHEVYSAMERGVVDGFIMNAAGFVDTQSWHEVTKYMIKPGFYRGGLILVANPESWDRLPADLQQKITDYKANSWNSDPQGGQWFLDYNEDQTLLIEESGVEVIELSSEDARSYLETAYESAWAEILEQEPVRGAKLKELLYDENLLPQ
jgi:TRAP-type C4-dicarboxylate transport system substrate-binding protein